MSTHLLRGTLEEKAALQAVEQITGVDLDAFAVVIASTDPTDKDGHCIFCKSKHGHGYTCQWVVLRASLGIGVRKD